MTLLRSSTLPLVSGGHIASAQQAPQGFEPSRQRQPRNLAAPAILPAPLSPAATSSHQGLSPSDLISTPANLISQSSDEIPVVISPQEAADCLELFRKKKSSFLPIMPFPPELSAEELQAERPFLWHCIMTVSVKSSSTRSVLERQTRRMVSSKMVCNDERSLELLQGLLVLLGW